jgi:hypothetical protein
MSFIREIVQIARENDVADARKNINKINVEIKNFQHKIKNYIDAEYVSWTWGLGNTPILDVGWNTNLRISISGRLPARHGQ